MKREYQIKRWGALSISILLALTGCDGEGPAGSEVATMDASKPEPAQPEPAQPEPAVLRAPLEPDTHVEARDEPAPVRSEVVRGEITTAHNEDNDGDGEDASAGETSDMDVLAVQQPKRDGVHTVEPKVAQLFRCWFRNFHDYMADESRGKLTSGGRSYGMLMAGTAGIMHYNGLDTCAGEIGNRPRGPWGDLSSLEALAGIPTASKHSGLAFDAVNPEFIAWARETLIPAPGATIEGITIQLAYDEVFSRLFRVMGETALLLHERYDINTEARRYLSDTDAGVEGPEWLEDAYGGTLDQYGADVDGTTMTPALAMGFWLRRSSDGSFAACWYAVHDVLTRYDRRWLDQQRRRYPKGWAAVEALPDPTSSGAAARDVRRPQRRADAVEDEREANTNRTNAEMIADLITLPRRMPSSLEGGCKAVAKAHDEFIRRFYDGAALERWNEAAGVPLIKTEADCKEIGSVEVAACQVHALSKAGPGLEKALPELLQACRDKFLVGM